MNRNYITIYFNSTLVCKTTDELGIDCKIFRTVSTNYSVFPNKACPQEYEVFVET